MSEVISFRLNKDNPREARALNVIISRCAEGYSIRYIVTEALLGYNDLENGTTSMIGLDKLNDTLSQVYQVLKCIGNNENLPVSHQDTEETVSSLTDSFVKSIVETANPGIKFE